MAQRTNRGYQKIRDLEMALRRREGERAEDDAKCAFPCALEELQRRAQCGRAMAKWLESWGKSSPEETYPLFLGSRAPERAFTRTKSEKQGLREAESSSRGGGGGGGGGVSPEPQYQQSLYNSSWRGGDSSSSPRERKEVIAAGLMSESLMNLEAAAGVGAGAAGGVAGGGRVMMTMMMMAQQHQQQQQQQPPQQQTRSTFWQALARTTSSNQINLFLSLDQAVVCTDVGGNITSW